MVHNKKWIFLTKKWISARYENILVYLCLHEVLNFEIGTAAREDNELHPGPRSADSGIFIDKNFVLYLPVIGGGEEIGQKFIEIM